MVVYMLLQYPLEHYYIITDPKILISTENLCKYFNSCHSCIINRVISLISWTKKSNRKLRSWFPASSKHFLLVVIYKACDTWFENYFIVCVQHDFNLLAFIICWLIAFQRRVFQLLEAQNYTLKQMSKQISAVHNVVSHDSWTTTSNNTSASSSNLRQENIHFDLPCVTELDLLSLE